MENNFIQDSNLNLCLIPESLFCFFDPQAPPAKSERKARKAKRRGRKKLRPGNPLKTEVLDKYWLRAFKNFIKTEYIELQLLFTDTEFWDWYLTSGKPGKNNEYLSYNSNYKTKLFNHPGFCSIFYAWGMIFGLFISPKKTMKVSWEFYYNYLYQELIPKACNLADFEYVKAAYNIMCTKAYNTSICINAKCSWLDKIN